MLRLSLDYQHIVELYRSGMSENQIAKQLGVARGTIRKRLIKAGITPRTQSEAESLKWVGMSIEQRSCQVAAAHEATRGRVHSEDEKIRRAQTNYRTGTRISPLEIRVAAVLRAHGLIIEQQFPIHTCNVDLAVHPGSIAVEVHGGGWHSTPTHRRLMAQKAEKLFGDGWALVEVWIDRRFSFERTADELIALIDELRGLPSAAGEHWMILGNRNNPARIRADGDHWTCVGGAHRRSNGAGFNTGVS